MTSAEHLDDSARFEIALGEQHEGVIQKVRRLACEGRTGRVAGRPGRLGHGVVLGRDQDLGRLFGDLSADGVDATVEQRGRV